MALDPSLKKQKSALNTVRLIALEQKRGKLVTSDNLNDVYPQLRNRKPQGTCNVSLINGSF